MHLRSLSHIVRPLLTTHNHFVSTGRPFVGDAWWEERPWLEGTATTTGGGEHDAAQGRVACCTIMKGRRNTVNKTGGIVSSGGG